MKLLQKDFGQPRVPLLLSVIETRATEIKHAISLYMPLIEHEIYNCSYFHVCSLSYYKIHSNKKEMSLVLWAILILIFQKKIVLTSTN